MQRFFILFSALAIFTGPAYGELIDLFFPMFREEVELSSEYKVFEEKNYKLKDPGSPWRMLTKSSLFPQADITLVRLKPNIAIVFGSTAGVPVNVRNSDILEAKFELIKSSGGQILSSEELGEFETGGIRGDLAAANISTAGKIHSMAYWTVIYNGYAYEITAVSRTLSRNELLTSLKEVLVNFEIVDRNKWANFNSGDSISEYKSDRYGYRIKLPEQGWYIPSHELTEKNITDFIAVEPSTEKRLAVFPITLDQRDLTINALSKSMLALWGLDSDKEKFNKKTKIKKDGLIGHEMDYLYEEFDKSLLYRFRMLKGKDKAYMVVASMPHKIDEVQKQLEKLLSTVTFHPTDESIPQNLMSKKELSRHGQAFNQAGLYYINKRNYKKGNELFSRSLSYEHDPVVLENVIFSLSVLQRYKEGLSLLNQYEIDEDPHLLSYAAYFNKQLGDNESAADYYSKTFSLDYNNESDFKDYINVLWELNRFEEAYEETKIFSEYSDSITVKVLLANLYYREKKYTDAVSLLTEINSQYTDNTEVLYELFNNYLMLENYPIIVEMAESFIDQDSSFPDIWYYKGRAEYELRWYKKSKESFEEALRLNPADKGAKNYLEYISGLIGEGTNSNIKEPIDPVKLPAYAYGKKNSRQLDFKESSAGYLLRARAYHFGSDGWLVTTDHITVKVLEKSAVDDFSIFEFSFDPLGESIYVNTLEVLDENGELIAEGDSSSYYVMDDTENGMATHDKLLSIPVPGLATGNTVKLVVSRKEYYQDDFFPLYHYSFSNRYPIDKSVLHISGELENLNVEVPKGIQKEVEDTSITYVMKNPVTYVWESYQPDYRKFLPTALISDKRAKWGKEAQKYMAMIEEKLGISDEMKSLANKITKGYSTTDEKISALSHYIQENITYKAIEFGRRGLIPNTGNEIVKLGYGDCKDHSVLLYVLAKALGLDVELMLVNNGSTITEKHPSIDQFNHMIAYCSECSNQFIDLTDKDISASTLTPRGLGGEIGLLLLGNESRLEQIPPFSENDNEITSNRRVEIKEDGSIYVGEKLTIEGYMAGFFRNVLKQNETANYINVIQEQLSKEEKLSNVEKVSIKNVDSHSGPLEIDMEYSVDSVFVVTGDIMAGSIPNVWERFYIGMTPDNNRETPFSIFYPLIFNSKIDVISPDKYMIIANKGNDKHVDQEGHYLDWKGSSILKDRKVKLDYQIKMAAGFYDSGEYSKYYDETVKSLGMLAEPFSLTINTP